MKLNYGRVPTYNIRFARKNVIHDSRGPTKRRVIGFVRKLCSYVLLNVHKKKIISFLNIFHSEYSERSINITKLCRFYFTDSSGALSINFIELSNQYFITTNYHIIAVIVMFLLNLNSTFGCLDVSVHDNNTCRLDYQYHC